MDPRRKSSAVIIAIALLISDFSLPISAGIVASQPGIQVTHREVIKKAVKTSVIDRTPNRTKPENRRPIILGK
jgi:hypothetical protein